MATGAEVGTLGPGVAVHLPINFHGLSEWKEKNRDHDSTHKKQRDVTPTRHEGLRQHASCHVERDNNMQWDGRPRENGLVSEAKGSLVNVRREDEKHSEEEEKERRVTQLYLSHIWVQNAYFTRKANIKSTEHVQVHYRQY